MESIIIYDKDEVFDKDYITRATGSESIENEIQEGKLRNYINLRKKGLEEAKRKIESEIFKINNLEPILRRNA